MKEKLTRTHIYEGCYYEGVAYPYPYYGGCYYEGVAYPYPYMEVVIMKE